MIDPELAASIERRISTAPFSNWMGIEMTAVEHGRCELQLGLEPHHLNPGGIAHGGIAASLLDSAIGLALRTTLPEGATHATLQLQVTYLRPIPAGTITARGTAVHAGKRIEYGEGELLDAEGRMAARGTATFMVLRDGSTPD